MKSLNCRAICLIAVTLLAACNGEAPTAAPSAAAASAIPADPNIAKIYVQTCKACHAIPGTGAPQAGDAKAWAPRSAQGMSTLLDHTLNGYKGMPPLGSCTDCGEADFEALIRFMAGIS
jgi:cytochrome c5